MNDLPLPGKERDALVRVRIGQSFFRRAVLAAHDFRCCITGLASVELLNASHIVPWSMDPANRLNPQNGLCLNALHDRAFDRHLITVDTNLQILVSSDLRGRIKGSAGEDFFLKYEGQKIATPKHFAPLKELLAHHNKIFRG
ncbi:MAG: HNH endonuclease [Stenotrophobium sp.]